MKDLVLRIAHLSDTHSRIAPHRVTLRDAPGVTLRAGGYPLLISAIRQERTRAAVEAADFMVFHSGDSFQGSAHFQQYPGALNAALLNLLNPDAMAVGNHEFDLGPLVFEEVCAAARFPIIASNVSIAGRNPLTRHRRAQAGPLVTADDESGAILRITSDGEPLAVLGLTLDTLPYFADVGSGIMVSDPITFARRQVAAVKGKGIHRILVLSHLGQENDEALAQAVPQISAIFGGHTHHLYGTADTFGHGKSRPCGARVGDVALFHCGENGQHFRMYHLRLDAKGRAVEAGGETITPVDGGGLPTSIQARLTAAPDVRPARDVRDLLESHFPLRGLNTEPIVIPADIPHVALVWA